MSVCDQLWFTLIFAIFNAIASLKILGAYL